MTVIAVKDILKTGELAKVYSETAPRLLKVSNRLLKNVHLLRFPHPSSFRRTLKYTSGRLTASSAWQESLLIRRNATLRISGALHLGIFEQPAENDFFSNLLKVNR